MSNAEIASLIEIPHPSKALGESIYGSTKVFPNYAAQPGETYLGMVHGIVHESSVSFVAVRLGLSLHGAREEDLIEGVIGCHPLDMQDAMIEYSRKGAIINTTWMF